MTNFRSIFGQSGIRQRSLRKHCRLGRATELVFVLATGLTLAIGGSADAQQVLTWDGGGGPDGAPSGGGGPFWNQSTNTVWQDLVNNDFAAQFDPNDSAIFGAITAAGATPGPYTVRVAGFGVTTNNIEFTADGITIGGNGDLSVNGEVTISGSNTATITTDIASGLVVNNSAGSRLNVNGNIDGQLQMNGDGTVSAAGDIRTVDSNAGTTILQSGAVVSGVVNTQAELDINGASMNRLVVQADGDVEVRDGATVNTTITNSGILFARTGELTATDGTTNQNGGTLRIGTAATLASDTENQSGGTMLVFGNLTGDVTNNGTATLGVISDISGEVTNTGALSIQGGTLNALDNSGAGDVDVDGGGNVTTTITNTAALDVNSGTLTATGGTTNLGTGTLTIDNGATLASDTENRGTATLTNNGTLTGDLTNVNGATVILNSGSDVSGGVTNGGVLEINGASMGSVNNFAAGDIDVRLGGTVDTTITNRGDVFVRNGTLTVTDGTTNQDSGVLTVGSSATLASDVTNRGTSTLTQNGIVDGALVNGIDATTDLNAGSDVTGNVTNNGDLNINDASMNALNNTSTGDVLVRLGGTVDTTVTNAGELVVGTGTFTVTGGTTNQSGGTLRVGSAGSLTSNVTNNAGGTLILNSSTVTGNVINNGDAMLNGTASVTGNYIQNANNNAVTTVDGTVTIGGTLDTGAGTLDLVGGSTITAGGGSSINGGTIDGTVNGDVTSTGDVDVTSTGVVNGTLSNSGTGSSNDGTVAALTNTAGSFENRNEITGLADIDGGVFTMNGGTVGSLDNAAVTEVIDDSAIIGALINNGTLNIATGQTLTATTITNQSGAINVGANATLSGTGNTIDNAAAMNVADGGTVTDAGAINNLATGSFTFAGNGTLAADDDAAGDEGITNVGDIAFDGGAGTTVNVTTGGAGAFENNDGGTISIATGSNVDVTGVGAAGLTNNSGGVLTNDGTLTGVLTNNTGAMADLNADSTVTGDVINAGDLNINGGAMDALINNAGGDVDVDGGGTVATTIINEGDIFARNGTLTASGGTTNQGGGALRVGSSATLASDVTNSGAAVLTNNGIVDGTLDNSATADLNAGSDVTGVVTNQSDLNINGGSMDALNNTSASVVNVVGGGTVDTTITNDGALDVNTGTLTANATTNQGAGVLTIDAGAELASNTTNTGAGTLDNNGTLTGTLNNSATANLNAGSDVTGAVSNTSDLNINGGSMGSLTNTGTGDVDVVGGGSVDTTITNSAALDVNTGTLTANNTINNGMGVLTIDAGAELASNLTNNGAATLANNGTLTGTLTNNATTDLNAGSDVAGTVANTGDLNINGGSIDVLNNTGTGDVDVVGGGTVGNTLTNEAALDVNSGTLTVANGTANQNGAALTVNAGGELASNVTNRASADLTIDGLLTGGLTNLATGPNFALITGDVDGAVTNSGNLDVTGGSLDSLINSTGGDVDFSGTSLVDTTITNSAALDINSGTTTVSGSTLNDADGVLNIAGGSTLASEVTNAGTVNLDGQITGDVSNAGTTNLAGQITGDVGNTGTLNVTDSGAAINGNLTAEDGSELNIEGATTTLNVTGDADLNGNITVDGALSGAETLIGNVDVGGNLSGNVSLTLDLDDSTGVGLFDFNNALLFSYTGTNDLSFNSFIDLPDQGALEYFIDDDGSSVVLRSRINSAVSGVAATVGLTQNLVDTIVNRPTSPFVADLAAGAEEDPCGTGIWTRATGGTANSTGSFTDTSTGVTGSSPVSLNYTGLQLGGDFACFGGHYNGWDLAFGGIAGFNNANGSSNTFSTTGVLENIIETDIFQTYAGVYVTAARGRFFADLQLRYEDTEFETSSTQVGTGGLSSFDDVEYDNVGQTVSGAIGYSFPLPEDSGLAFVTSAGFQFTRNETDDVVLGTDGVLTFEDGFNRIGFISASLAKSKILPDEESLISYFGTATYYNDFSSDRDAVFQPTTSAERSLALDTLGSYGEISLGVNYLKLLSPGDAGNARQLNASLRVDGRFNDDLESYGLTGQIRLQF